MVGCRCLVGCGRLVPRRRSVGCRWLAECRCLVVLVIDAVSAIAAAGDR